MDARCRFRPLNRVMAGMRGARRAAGGMGTAPCSLDGSFGLRASRCWRLRLPRRLHVSCVTKTDAGVPSVLGQRPPCGFACAAWPGAFWRLARGQGDMRVRAWATRCTFQRPCPLIFRTFRTVKKSARYC
jgi:hypothetical protein